MSVPTSSPARRRRVLLVALLALLAAGCQVRVATDVGVDQDGSGRLAVTVALDEELATSLTADDFDPFAGLESLPDGWSVERSEPDGGLAATVAADFADPAGLSQRVSQLAEGLDEEDPLLLEDVDLQVDEDGSARLSGRAGLRLPSSTGLDGGGLAFDGDDLRALVEERGAEVLRVDLRVSMPGPVVDGNADEVDGGTATWQLTPGDDLVAVEVVSDPPSSRTWQLVAAGVVGVVVGFLGLSLVRRRRR